ncbi:MAG: YicC/YloC family endoribonuclease [Pseudomonadota bacterium]
MTAFASRTGGKTGASWVWEMRSVNARGLDLRFRLPEGLDGLEAELRRQITAGCKRGNISLTLRLAKDAQEEGLVLDAGQLDRVLTALEEVQERAFEMGVTLGQPTAADVLSHRGVVLQGGGQGTDPDLLDALKADIGPLVADLLEMRSHEGQALAAVVSDQVAQIEALVTKADAMLETRRDEAAKALKTAMQRVLDEVAVEPERLAQELAVLAVKSDVTEEIDRLKAHVTATRDLLKEAEAKGVPVGRKLDFLSQEFNREANTLCSKSQYAPLTAIGLDLKTVIDQMREQIQNVE